MNIAIYIKKFYDWEPLPSNVKPTDKDIAALRVKPASNGGWLMRVPRETNTHTTVNLPESEIVAMMIATLIRDKRMMSRTEAAGSYLQKMILPHHFHRSWVTDISVDSGSPDENLLRAELVRFEAAGLVEQDDIDDVVMTYLKDEGMSVSDSLLTFFGARNKVNV